VYNKEAAQISAYRTLVAGQRYYIEALQKEGGGGDHLSVAWTLPGTTATNVIPGDYLEPFDLGFAPQFANQSLSVFESAINGVVIGRLSASDSPLDTFTFQILDGNTNETFALNPATGDVILNDNSLIADGSVANFALLVAVQDSGSGGLYPLRTAQAMVSINVISTNSPLVWLGASTTNRWSDPGNWGGIVPYEGSRLIFGAPSQQANLNDVLTQVAWVRMTNSGFKLSGNPLTLQSGLTNNGNNSWNLDTTLAGHQAWNNASGTLTVGGDINNAGFSLSLVGATDIRVSGALSGSGSVSKTGAGKLLIAGAHDLSGVLNIASAGTSLTALEVNGSSDLDLAGADLVMSGRMDLWNRSATIGGLSGNGTIFANDSARRLTVGANNHSGNFSGVLANYSWATGATLGLLKTGTGTQVLGGANTYSGGTIIRSGQITASSAYALGAGLVTLGDTGTGTNSVTLAASLPVTITNSLVVSAQAGSPIAVGTANFSPGTVNMQYSGPLTLNRDLLLQAGSTDRTTFAGPISGQGGLEVVSPFGPNRRIVLDRASGLSNTFAGNVLIGTNAVLQAGNSTSIGNRTVPDTAMVSFSPGAQLRFAPSSGGDSETIAALDSLVPGAGQIDMATAMAFTLGFGARDGFFSGSIIDTVGTLALRKSGPATQVLAGPANFAGLVTVSGGTLVVASDTALGAATSGTVVSSGATLALSNNLAIASEVLSLNGAGINNSGALRNDDGQNTWSGIVSLAGPAKVRAGTGQLTLADVSLGVSTLTLETLNDAAILLSGSGSGLGGLEKAGPGPVTLSGTNVYTGPTTVAEGRLILASSAAISNTTPITVQSILDASALTNWVLQASQTLQGNGVVTGAVTVLGTLSPGASLGNLTIQGDVSLAGTTRMEISRSASGPTNDVLTSTGAIIPGGLLVVTNIGPDLPVPGDTFRIFVAGAFASGAFATIELPQISGVAWDTSRLYAEGVLVAIAGEPSQPPPLSLGSTNGVLTITWPADYTSYVLHAQTNATGAGLSETWYPVPEVSGNTFVIPIDSAQGSVFYRLQKQ